MGVLPRSGGRHRTTSAATSLIGRLLENAYARSNASASSIALRGLHRDLARGLVDHGPVRGKVLELTGERPVAGDRLPVEDRPAGDVGDGETHRANCSSAERSGLLVGRGSSAPMQTDPTRSGKPKAARTPTAQRARRGTRANARRRGPPGRESSTGARVANASSARTFAQACTARPRASAVTASDTQTLPKVRCCESNTTPAPRTPTTSAEAATTIVEDRAHRRRAPRPRVRCELDRSHWPSSTSSSLGERQTRVQATTGAGSRPHANHSDERIRRPRPDRALPPLSAAGELVGASRMIPLLSVRRLGAGCSPSIRTGDRRDRPPSRQKTVGRVDSVELRGRAAR